MRPKIKIISKEINEWRSGSWSVYVSQLRNTRVLKLWANMAGGYRVVYGSEIRYEGTQLPHAIAAWDAI